MAAFDAGAIESSLTVDTSKFDKSLADAEAKVKAFEDAKHEVKISAVFDTSSLSRARQQFAQLDQQISKDAMARLRSNPQGSVLGALNALFSPHQVTGAPSASQAAQQGLLGKIVQAPGTGNAGPATGQNVVQAVTGSGGGQSNANQDITTTDRVNTVGLPQSGGTISTEDRVNVTGLPTSGGTIVTEDKVKADLDTTDVKAKAAQAGKDAADEADDALTSEAKSKGSGWFSGFLNGVAGMTGKAVSGGGSSGNGKNSNGKSGSSDSGSALDSGLIGGIGPGIAGVSTKAAAITAAVGTALAALPALAGVAGTGIGTALIGAAVAGVVAESPKLKAQFTAIGGDVKTVLLAAAGPLIPALSAVLDQVPALVKQLQAPLAGIFATIAPQIQGVFSGLIPVLDGVVGVMQAAAPAFGPFIEALENLASSVFPGIESVVRATVPLISQFGTILGQLGSNLGGLFASAAPAIQASMTVLGDLLSVVGSLLPVLTQLGGIFATALAPVFTEFGGVVKSLEPVLVLVGQVVASLAKAVVGDLVSAFGAIASAVKAATPGLTALATGLGNVFTVMENAGVFAVLGDSLENLAGPIGTLVGTLASGLVPVLTQVVQFAAQLSSVLVAQLTSAIVQLLPSVTQLATVALAALSSVLPVVLPLLVQVAGVLTAALAATITGIATALTAVVTAVPPALLGAIATAVAAVAAGMKLWALAMAAVEGSGLVAAVTGMIDVVTAFTEATEGLTAAQKALVATELVLEAVNPLGWAVAGAAAIAAVVYGLSQLNDGIGANVQALAKQDDAVGYNISGYQKLAAQTQQLGQAQSQAADSIGASAAKNAGQVKQVLSSTGAAYTSASVQFTALAQNLQSRLAALSGTFGVSQTQIEKWATAAGISAQKFGGAGENVGQLTGQIAAYIDKNAAAVTATASLGTNVAIFGSDVLSANTQLDAFNSIWNTLVGNLLSKQQAITQSKTAFDNLKQSISDSGKSSDQTAQSFQAYIQQVSSSASALESSGASVSTINSYLQTQIGNLESLGPLNKDQQADLAAVKAVQDQLANSTHGLNSEQQTLISQFESGLIPSLQQIGADTPSVTSAIGKLTDSIIQTGNSSASTKSDRAQLIADLEQAGVTSQDATKYVDGLQTSIGALKGKVVTIGAETGSAVSAVQSFAAQVASLQNKTVTINAQVIGATSVAQAFANGMATGGLVTAGTGPVSDDVLVRVSKGETVVPAHLTPAFAPAFKAAGIPGFAAGGIPGGEAVAGWGSGRSYSLGGGGTAPQAGVRASGASMDDLAARLDQLHADMREMVNATRAVPAGVGQHVGGAINGAASAASFRSRYPR